LGLGRGPLSLVIG